MSELELGEVMYIQPQRLWSKTMLSSTREACCRQNGEAAKPQLHFPDRHAVRQEVAKKTNHYVPASTPPQRGPIPHCSCDQATSLPLLAGYVVPAGVSVLSTLCGLQLDRFHSYLPLVRQTTGDFPANTVLGWPMPCLVALCPVSRTLF